MVLPIEGSASNLAEYDRRVARHLEVVIPAPMPRIITTLQEKKLMTSGIAEPVDFCTDPAPSCQKYQSRRQSQRLHNTYITRKTSFIFLGSIFFCSF
jgi:hypothetical protein